MKEANAHEVCWMSVASASPSNRGLTKFGELHKGYDDLAR